MNQLVFIENKKIVTDSITIAEAFGKEHKHVLRDINELGCSQDFRQSNFGLSTYKSVQGKELPKYFITQDGFTLLAMGYTGKVAMEFKEKYINEFNRMKQELQSLYAPSYMIDDPVKRAEKWIEEQKQLKALTTDNLVLNQQVNELKPKASYYDLVLQNKSLLTVSKIAKDYGMSAKTLNKKLHELGVQFKQGDIWLLYSKYQDKGYTQTTTHVIDADKSTINTKWTQKGRLFLYDLLKNEGILPMIEREEHESA
ncbi:Rha family transcriptional regulator [Fictibacillus sp. JL2B1089]|uniref:Rha family transcriptional regulator n=1 Tax=Fictibacillus sp. JL2B1089 TaxID=3399565 RepID=UPI003A8599D0